MPLCVTLALGVQCSFMKPNKLVTFIVVAMVVLAIPFITEYLLKRHDFDFLSDQFVPVFDDVNEQLGNGY